MFSDWIHFSGLNWGHVFVGASLHFHLLAVWRAYKQHDVRLSALEKKVFSNA